MMRNGHSKYWHGRRGATLTAAMALTIVVAVVWTSAGTPTSPVPGQQLAGGGTTTPQQSGDIQRPGSAPPANQGDAAAQPVGLRLSAGHAQRPAVPVRIVAGDPLGNDRVAAIVGRLSPWSANGDLAKPFQWPTQTTPKPRAGTTVETKFPGAGGPNRPVVPAAGPLHILRMQPQGAVSIAPFISITFDRPMVPVATVTQLAEKQVPAAISPKLPGTWAWIGTSTLRFVGGSKDIDRLPMATDFTVTVPAGTRAPGGVPLASAATFRFSTPPPTVKHLEPTGAGLALTPVFLAVFDQRVDPQRVMAAMTVTVGGEPWPVRQATAAEVAADPLVSVTVATASAGRVVTFRPIRAFPTDQPIAVTFGAGTPSAEGPRTTARAATFNGRTYAAVGLAKSDCGGGPCEPGAPLMLTFNNALDVPAFDRTTIRITPEIPGGATVVAEAQTVTITGATQADTTYTVTVPAGLKDSFGQQLAKPAVSTIAIGKAIPRLDPFQQAVTTLDPMVDRQSITVNTVNRIEFRERVFAVSPSDWPAYQQWYVKTAQNDQQEPMPDAPKWPVLVDRIVPIGGAKSRLVSTTLDLTAQVSGRAATGHVVVLIEPTANQTFSPDTAWQNRPTMTWVQKTNLGLDALNDATQLKTWVTDLQSGSPLSDVTVGMVGSDGRVDPARAVVTGADGLASMELSISGAGALLATRGTQTALLPSGMFQSSWAKTSVGAQLLWFVNDDRQTYRPGETVSVKGWVRRQGQGVLAALTALPPTSTVSFTAHDGYGVDIGHGTTTVSRLGGFDFTVRLPAGVNLGSASIDLSSSGIAGVDNPQFNHPFQIADFRTPDFQVDTQVDSAGPSVAGNDLTVAAAATYYAGGPLADAPVAWQIRTATATYAPPGWSQYSFGIWTPWWQTDTGHGGPAAMSAGGPAVPCCGPVDPTSAKVDTFNGRTDSGGSNYLQVQVGDLGRAGAGLPVTVTAQATVTDVNQQAIAGTTDLLVHPADFYVGLAGDDTFVTQGKPTVVRAIATDIDGAVASGRRIDMRSSRITTSFTNGASVDTESDTQNCQVTSTAGPVTCTFHPSVAGTYRITATVTDTKGRTSRSELTRWVAGPDGSVDRTVALQQLTLVPDKREYQPGESARVLVQSPIEAGNGLVTVLHNGIVSASKFTVTDGSAVVSLPVTEAEMPGITASIEVVDATPRSTGGSAGALRPAYATGEIGLTVSTKARTLKVTAAPRQKTVKPGGSTVLDVSVTDQQGKPLSGSEFEVVVADEAVLALGGYQLPDPIKAFYPALSDDLNAFYGRSQVMLSDQPVPPGHSGAATAAAGSSAASSAPAASAATPDSASVSQGRKNAASTGGTAGAFSGSGSAAIAERKNFAALALFVAAAATDSSGHSTINVPLPDSLTRYRVMVVAVAGNTRFGSAESTITAALPLTVRPSAPAFLNFGDKLELPVLVQNQTDAPLTTDVVVQSANLELIGPVGKRITVPARGRVEVRFGASAESAGTAKLRVVAVSGDNADSATVELPVYTPSTTETFASYGQIEGGGTVLQRVTAPTGVIKQFGGLQISTASTALQQLTDAVGYLAEYQYESSDGLAGQIIAIGGLGDVLKAFSAPGLPLADTLKALVAGDVGKLTGLQNDDGGFAYWRRGDISDAFNSIQSTQALLFAVKQGLSVPPDSLSRAQDFLDNITSHFPSGASQATKDTLLAYALNVSMQAGHPNAASAAALVSQRGVELPLDAVAWLLPAVTDPAARASLERIVGNAALDNAASVTFANHVTDDAWTTLQSDRRTDGLILDALLSVRPDSDLVPKIVSGLMAAQTSGRWDNLQENAFILLALRHYYDVFEKTDPNFVAASWLGDRFAGQHAFRGHTTEQAVVSIPTAELRAGSSDVTLRNDGTGRLYYRLGLQTAPDNLLLTSLDRGFVVSRSYQGVDNTGDVTRDANGTWHIRAGARVRVRLELVSRSAQTHVALIDPLPAGLQVLNPELATTPKDLDPAQAAKSAENADQFGGDLGVASGVGSTGVPAADSAMGTWWYSTWYDHQNLRADRVEAFATQLQGGVYQYSYLARATIDGSFVAPPTRAEQIYAPETFGRAATDRVVIEG